MSRVRGVHKECAHLLEGDADRVRDRIPVDAAGDQRKGDAGTAVFGGQCQTVAIAGPKQVFLAARAVAPHGTGRSG